MDEPRYSIAHPTEFSETSRGAFCHALRLALAKRAELNLLHIDQGARSRGRYDHFPAVRETLARWGLIAPSAPREAVDRELGILVSKVGVHDQDEAAGVDHFARENGVNLIVVGTAGRDGVDRVLHGSVSEDIAAHADIPTLFVQSGSRGFVDEKTGALSLSRILVPVAHAPDPSRALYDLAVLLPDLGLTAEAVDFVHVGDDPPVVYFGLPRARRPVRVVSGDPVDTILKLAEDADLVVMPTERRNSLMDRILGTKTERVVRQSPCPVLAIPG